jgi:hypothetical protein
MVVCCHPSAVRPHQVVGLVLIFATFVAAATHGGNQQTIVSRMPAIVADTIAILRVDYT